ncbi:MAG: serine protease [Phycisphaerae bacterium]
MMTQPTGSRIAVAAMVFGAVGLAAPSRSAAGEDPDFKKIIDRHAPSIVTVKFVLKMQFGMMPDNESESEIPGVMIDPKGLVLCANSQLAGPMGMLKRFMPPGMQMTSEPKDLKVIIGADDEEYDAKIVARDSDLDLAWIQIEDAPDKKFAAADLSKASTPVLGEKLYCVRRLGKLYNRAPAVRVGRVCGVTESPRELYVSNTELSYSLGLPVFQPSGELAGMVVMQMPEEEEVEGAFNPMSMLGSMGSMMEMFTGVILPAKQLASATKRVKASYIKELKELKEKTGKEE